LRFFHRPPPRAGPLSGIYNHRHRLRILGSQANARAPE
jgi:hypothetical protein